MADIVPALTVIRGSEPLLVDRATTRIAQHAAAAFPDIERRESPVVGLSAGEFSELVAPSLFSQPRLIVLLQAQLAVKELTGAILDYIATPLDDVFLIVQFGGKGAKNAFAKNLQSAGAHVVECAAITRDADRLNFLRSEIKAAGGQASAGAVAALLEGVGQDLAELASAAAQLVSDTDGAIDEAAVRRYHRGRAAVTGFAIADLAVAGNISGALEALRWAFSVGVAHVLIADALADSVRTIGKVAGAGGGRAEHVASQWGMPVWKVDKTRRVSRGWSAAGIAQALQAVTELNADVKGYAADPDYALERAVISVGRAQRLQ